MRRRTLITGGAGFVGTNLADRILRDGERVIVFDNLARAGVEENLAWLTRRHGRAVDVELADVRDAGAVARAVGACDRVFHLAAQVAVTTSLDEPVEDVEVNLTGTINVLEAARAQTTPPPVIFTSTNKVYGGLDDIELAERETRYEPVDPQIPPAVSPSRAGWRSAPRTAAPRAPPTSTSSTTRAPTACRPSSFG